MISIAKKISETEEKTFEEQCFLRINVWVVEYIKTDKSPGQDGLTSGTI